MSESKILENRLTLLENSVMSLNTLWKMSVLMQGPSFTDGAIMNLETALSDNPDDPVVQDAIEDLKQAVQKWKNQTGGSFGVEDTQKKYLDGLFGRITAIQFVLFLNILQNGLQNGVQGLNVMFDGISNRRMQKNADVSEAFRSGSQMSFDYFLMEIKKAIEHYEMGQTVEKTEGERGRPCLKTTRLKNYWIRFSSRRRTLLRVHSLV